MCSFLFACYYYRDLLPTIPIYSSYNPKLIILVKLLCQALVITSFVENFDEAFPLGCNKQVYGVSPFPLFNEAVFHRFCVLSSPSKGK